MFRAAIPLIFKSHGSYPAVRIPVPLPGQIENADHSWALPSCLGSLSSSQLLPSFLLIIAITLLSSPASFLASSYIGFSTFPGRRKRGSGEQWALPRPPLLQPQTPELSQATAAPYLLSLRMGRCLFSSPTAYEPRRMKDTPFTTKNSEVKQASTVQLYIDISKEHSFTKFGDLNKAKSTIAQPQRQLSTTSFTSFSQHTEATGPHASWKRW